MKALLQRVNSASVSIDGQIYSEIKKGILIFLGVEKNDNGSEIEFLANKVLNLRIFEDEQDKNNPIASSQTIDSAAITFLIQFLSDF